jgi:hypothetical protein
MTAPTAAVALRRALLAGCGLLLAAGVWAGLARMGIAVPTAPRHVVGTHGPLAVLGVFGTLIALERAVALGRAAAYVPPLLTAAGAVALLAGGPLPLAQLLLAGGGLGLVAVFVVLHRRQPALHIAVMGLAAALWPCAVLVWSATGQVAPSVPWLAGFLVLTIVGERLELTRVVGHSRGVRALLLAAVGLFVGGLVVALGDGDLGVRIAGAGLVGQAVWLLRHDLAPRAVRRDGLPRFIGVALTVGYGWLVVAGVLWLLFGATAAGPRHDAAVHALFLGFVLSMVIGHAPLILPAVLRLTIPYRPVLYVPLVLLHATLLLRTVGSLLGAPGAARLGAIGNAVALAALPAAMACALAWGRRGTSCRAPTPTPDAKAEPDVKRSVTGPSA